MFGYITINKPELKIKEFNEYHAYYCGLCNTLRVRHGMFGQMTLSYDMTFLVLLLTSLYESKTEHKIKHCIVHPIQKHDMLINEISEYAADINIALSYHHFLDDWQDERKVTGIAGAAMVKQKYKEIEKKYERQCNAIKKTLQQLHQYEKEKENNIEKVSRCFGELMEEIFIYRKDEWEPILRRMGFFMGKFIYMMDAYHDVKDDIKKGCYNPLIAIHEKEDFEDSCKEMLEMMMAEAAKEFEKLPCVKDVEILRNIIYAGVWKKYDKLQKDKLAEGKEE